MKWTAASIRTLEAQSIRDFVESAADAFRGQLVLDVGSGRQPYRDVVEQAGGEYHAFDSPDFPASTVQEHTDFRLPTAHAYGAVLCTQVIQYVPYPAQWLEGLKSFLTPAGVIVLTYPTCWDEVEPDDLFRYTRAGIGRLFAEGGWDVLRNDHRAHVPLGGFNFHLGGGVIAAPKGFVHHR